MNPRPTALRRALAVVLGMLLTGAAAAVLVPAASAATTPLVTVELTSVTVTGSGPDGQLELRGRVSNPTGSQVYGLRMAMWRSRDPIDELETVRRAAGDNPPWGVILPSGYDKISEQDEVFAAGTVADFVLHATLAELGFDTPGMVYAVGARALGTTDGGIGFGNVGQASIVVPIPGQQSVPVTRLVVLTAPPTKLATNLFGNENLATELAGRLDTLLTAAAEPGMSWAIDPALYDEVADLANGYQVRAGDSATPGTGQRVAAEWLARFQRLDQRAGARTLFAGPDLTGAAAEGEPEVAARAVAATAAVARLDRLPLVVVPTGDVYADTTDALPTGLADAPLLATNLVTAGALQSAPDGRRVLASAVSLGSGQPTFDNTQLVLAETLVAGPSGQLRVLREPADLVADDATTAVWMTPRPVADLLTATPAVTAEFSEVTAATLTAAQFAAVDRLEHDFEAYAALAPESTIAGESTAALARAASTAWIADPAGQKAMLSAFDDLVGPAAMAEAVTLDASPRFVMSTRSNQFPLTVTNHLTEPIRVKVVVATDNPQRLAIPDSDLISIPAGQSQTVTIQPEATANGIAIARARVVTQDGQRVTPDTTITIEMTELGFIGWVIVIASGLVVVAATVLRIRQVRRKAAAQAAPAGAAAPEHVPAEDATTEPRNG
ncbi:MAG: DUF6049 family protein [Propionicimonas sp.]|nr:DUF6049 family protein [Propionicimonas sp.]